MKRLSGVRCSTCDYRRRRRDPANCRYCGAPLSRGPVRGRSHVACLDGRNARWAAWRIDVINHYGGKCACCGELELRFLTLDHVDGGGSMHRRTHPHKSLWLWLKKNGYPGGYQVLCWNCNCGRAVNHGVCPHVDVRVGMPL